MKEIIISALISTTFGGFFGYLILRYFYKKSILFPIGFVVIAYAMLIVILSDIGHRNDGISDFLWAIPVSGIALIAAFKYLNFRIKRPLDSIIDTFNLLQKGNITATKINTINTDDEFGAFQNSANKLIDGFANMASFAKEIGQGNLEADYELLSEDDSLGKALLEMKSSLIKANEEDKIRKNLDEKANWVSAGHAKFGDILRAGNSEDIYYSIISNIVKYLNANQGGLFLVNDDDQEDRYIELKAMYAYERKKYINKRIEFGSSLVGQCILEGESIFMTHIPKNYISVTSGLGTASPSSLLIVPLQFNDKTFGVIELASFKVFQQFEIDFIEKLSESIASSIATHQINEQTRRLLEDSKIQSEELAAQEEEIRQNMEELQSTQEESSRRETEMTSIFNALQSSTLYMEIDFDGIITNINNNFANLVNNSSVNIQGKKWEELPIYGTKDLSFQEIKTTLMSDNTFTRDLVYDNNKITETYSIIYDFNGDFENILAIGIIR